MRWFSLFYTRQSEGSVDRRLPRRSLQAETLETRQLLTALPASMEPVDMHVPFATVIKETIEFDEATGIVQVNGTSGLDMVTIEPAPWLVASRPVVPFHVNGTSVIRVIHEDVISGDETIRTFAEADVSQILFYGNGHNDLFFNYTGIPSEAYGGDGDDQLFGGSGSDRLLGEGGQDTIEGGEGDDNLFGGAGNDLVTGGEGDDVVYGGQGEDTLNGNGGKDAMFGGKENDTLDGGQGDDELYGREGNDTLLGKSGDDVLYGDEGKDILSGGKGNDQLHGGKGGDELRGGEGEDQLWGNEGPDLLEGESDDDELRGGDGHDRVYGGGGDDELFGGHGRDGLWGGAGLDVLTGGWDEDRYLLHDVKDADDIITTQTAADVVIHLEDADAEKHKGIQFDGGSWLYDEVLEIDEAFAEMANRTKNNALLLTSKGKELTFRRLGGVDASDLKDAATAWNKEGSGKITITDLAFDSFHDADEEDRDEADDSVHHVVYHEVAHNWDDENDNWGEWKDISGWTNPLFGPWQHDGTATFATAYAETGPHEDFAETFAADLLFNSGEVPLGSLISGMSDMPAKHAFIDDFFDSLI